MCHTVAHSECGNGHTRSSTLSTQQDMTVLVVTGCWCGPHKGQCPLCLLRWVCKLCIALTGTGWQLAGFAGTLQVPSAREHVWQALRMAQSAQHSAHKDKQVFGFDKTCFSRPMSKLVFTFSVHHQAQRTKGQTSLGGRGVTSSCPSRVYNHWLASMSGWTPVTRQLLQFWTVDGIHVVQSY